MHKSFLLSLALSFVFAFTTIAYLASPISPRLQIVTADADTIPVIEESHGIPFGNLNIISMHEIFPTLSGSTAAPTETQTAPPARLVIPSIGLDTSVEGVGINSEGEMDVPSGSSPNVGWYEHGTIPGNLGSAVIDAHVYAAFSNLKNLTVGSSVFVVNAYGEQLEFVVDDTRVYELGKLSANALFARKDARRLNLVTCAGSPTADGSTYTHRLVVYTTLVA